MSVHRPVALLFALAAAAGSSQLPSDILAAHNAIRDRVGVPPLIWSNQLASRAREWAGHLLEGRQFYHRPNSNYGENLFAVTGAAASAAEVVQDSASESRDYNHHWNACRGVCGHYTQLVWRDTREVGCAVASDARREVWVCNYNPPGNWVGQRPY